MSAYDFEFAAVPTKVGDLDLPGWELAAGRASPIAPRLSQPLVADVMPAPSSGFQKTFPEYAVIEPDLLTSAFQSIAKAPDVGLGVIDSLTGGLFGKAGGAVTSAIAPLIPEPVARAGEGAAKKVDELAAEGIGTWMRRISAVFNPRKGERSLLGEGDKLSFFGGDDLGSDLADAGKMVATALVLLRGPGLASKALHAARMGSTAEAVGSYATSFSNTFRGQPLAAAARGLSAAKTAETTAQRYGRFAGLATQAVSAVGLGAEFALPKVAGDEEWAQDILNNRVVPEDSVWRFPFELAVSLPLDLPSYLGAAKESRAAGAAGEKLFGPGRNVQTFLLPRWKQAVDSGLTTQAKLEALHSHSVKDYAKKTLLDDYKVTSGPTEGEIGRLPYIDDIAKAKYGGDVQAAANALISERINDLYKVHGTDKLHRLAAEHADQRFGWSGLDESARLEHWNEYYDTALPLEREFPDLVLSVNQTDQLLQRDAALGWLKDQKVFDAAARRRFELDFPSLKTEEEHWARRLSREDIIKKLNELPAAGDKRTASVVAKLGQLTAQKERINAAILAGDKSLRGERTRILGEIQKLRDRAVKYHENQAKVIEAQLYRREAELLASQGLSLSERVAVGLEFEALQRKLSDARIAMRDARLAGSRWQLEKFSDGTARMRLVDDLGVRSNALERTGPGKAWDRLFGALPNRELALKAENFLYEQAGKAGQEPGKVDRLMAMLSDRLDIDNAATFFGFKRIKYASIYNIEPHVIDELAKKAGLASVPPGMKSWGEVFYRAYPGPLRILQEAFTGKSVKVPYSSTLVQMTRTMYPQLRFYFSPRFVAVNLYERKILGGFLGGKKFFTEKDPRLTRLGDSLTRYETAANTGFNEVDVLPEELGRLTGPLTNEYVGKLFVNALRKSPEMQDALRSVGVNPDRVEDVVKYVQRVVDERMKLAKFEVPLTKAEAEVKAKLDKLELELSEAGGMGQNLAKRTEYEELHRELLASVVRRHVRKEAAELNKRIAEEAAATTGPAAHNTPTVEEDPLLSVDVPDSWAPRWERYAAHHEPMGAPNAIEQKTLPKDERGPALVELAVRDNKGKLAGVLDFALKDGGGVRSVNIVVRPDVRRAGYATKLLDEAVLRGYPIKDALATERKTAAGRQLIDSWMARRAADARPGAAANEAAATAQGSSFAPKTGAALKLSADQTIKAYQSAKTAYARTRAEGGSTIRIDGYEPKKGFSVSPYKELEFTKPGAEFKADDPVIYTRKNLEKLSEPDHYLGTWHDKETDIVYLDVSVVKSNLDEAFRVGREHNQEAVFDLATGKVIPIPKAPSGPSGDVGGRAGGGRDGLRGRLEGRDAADAELGRVNAELTNLLARANYRALDDSRRIFLGNPERSALERGLNSYLLYWPISYQLKVGRALFKFLTGKAFNLPTGSAPGVAWARLYEEVQQHIAADDEVGRWFTDHKEALHLLQQFLPMTPDSVGATLSPFTRLAGSVVGLGQDPDPSKYGQRIASQGIGYDSKLVERVLREFIRNNKDDGGE